MSTLNISVIAFIAVVVALVMVFNFWQSRVNRRAAERLFRQQNGLIEERAGIARRRQASFERTMDPEHSMDDSGPHAFYADDPYDSRAEPAFGQASAGAARVEPASPGNERVVSSAPLVTPARPAGAGSAAPGGSVASVQGTVPGETRGPILDRFAEDLRRITDRMPKVLHDGASQAEPGHGHRPAVASPRATSPLAASPMVEAPGGMTVDLERLSGTAGASPVDPRDSLTSTSASVHAGIRVSPAKADRANAPADSIASTQSAAPSVTPAPAAPSAPPARPAPSATTVSGTSGLTVEAREPAANEVAETEAASRAGATSKSAEAPLPDFLLYVTLLPPSAVNADRLIALMSSLRHAGTKPVRIEIDGGDGTFVALVAGGLATRIRCSVLLANRQGPLNAIELSDFVAALSGFAEQLGARFEQPDMSEVLARARRLDSLAADLDTQVELTVEAPGPVSGAQLVTIGKSLGLYERGAGRFACLSDDGHSLYAMSAAAGADQILFVLDIPRVDREAQPWPAMVRCASDCARLVGGRLVDSQARGLSVGMIEAVGRQLEERFEQLESAGFKAGSDVSLLVFN